MVTRRKFNKAMAALAFAGLSGCTLGKVQQTSLIKRGKGYGELIPDPQKLLDLPKGFHYQVISAFNQEMNDGLHVPDRADGMGCLALDSHRVALIRNHELKPSHLSKQPLSIQTYKDNNAYDTYANGVALPGGLELRARSAAVLGGDTRKPPQVAGADRHA